jgi:pyridoxine 4-dehydrogenase
MKPAARSATFLLGGTTPLKRLGLGTLQLSGPGVWGPPRNPPEARRVLRRALELGVNFIDTADCYGPFLTEMLIKEALYPYPDGLVIATKVGLIRPGPGKWRMLGRPEELREQVELSLYRLGLERIELLQLQRIDLTVPVAEQVGELAALQQEGKIHHIGLCEVTVRQLLEAQQTATIASVQNLYNVAHRTAETLVEHAKQHAIAFIPSFPLADGGLARRGGPLGRIAVQLGATPAQVALAWLLNRSPQLLPIPSASTVAELVEYTAASAIDLTEDQMQAVADAVASPLPAAA